MWMSYMSLHFGRFGSEEFIHKKEYAELGLRITAEQKLVESEQHLQLYHTRAMLD